MVEFELYDSNLRMMDGFTLVRRDPYGFWYITKDGKDAGVPAALKGHAFTSTNSAAIALKTELAKLPKVEKKSKTKEV